MGAALDTVSAAYDAVLTDRFDRVEGMLARDIDWLGLAQLGAEEAAPSCHGRASAISVMRRGWKTRDGEISVLELRERGDRVLAEVERRADTETARWFMVVQVRENEIVRMHAYAQEADALAALDSTLIPERAPALLEASDIAKRFGSKVVLDGVSLSAHAGEAVAVVGENGAGKSTLLGVCAGLIHPDHGRLAVRARLGFCPQRPGVFDLLTADEHLALWAPALGISRSQALEEGRRLLAEFGFRNGDRSPARHLSGGSRQKLNLALALLGGARVLLLDEPYQGFDHGAYVSFWEHVERWKGEGLAVVVVTHLLTDMALVDRVFELRIPRARLETDR